MGNEANTKKALRHRKLLLQKNPQAPLKQIIIEGNTLQHIFNRALLEMAQIIKPGACSAACHSDCIINVELSAKNQEGLLISLLNKVLEINELHQSIFYYMNFEKIDENLLVGQVFGIWYDNVYTRIKPISTKDCTLILKDGSWKCTIIFHLKRTNF